jgi:hypothetical protein
MSTPKDDFIMRPVLKSLVAVFALIFAAGPMVRAVDFYATNDKDKNIYGVNIDGTVSLIGSAATQDNNYIWDIATNPADQSTYLLELQSGSSFPTTFLYSAIIGTSSVSTSLIGTVSTNPLIEGGLTFSSFQGTNKLYAAGIQVDTTQNAYPILASIDPTTAQSTIISSGFMPNSSSERADIQSIFNAPDGRLWGYNVPGTSPNPLTGRTELFRFATDGTVDITVPISGIESYIVAGVAVKNGTTYYLGSPSGLANSSFGTLGWDSVNSTYTGTFNLITNSIVGGMTGMTLAPTTVPEPSTYVLAAIASGVMAALARRRKAKLVK